MITDDINIYEDSSIILERKNPKCVISWITILILTLITVIFISSIHFNIYKTYSGYVTIKDNKSYLFILLDESDFPINKNDKLYIKQDRYDYKIISIEDNSLLIELSIKDDIKIENNKITVNILKNRTRKEFLYEKIK